MDDEWMTSYPGDANIFFNRSSLLRPFRDLRMTHTLTSGRHRRIFSSRMRPNSLVTPVRSTVRPAYHSRRDILVDCGSDSEESQLSSELITLRNVPPNARPSREEGEDAGYTLTCRSRRGRKKGRYFCIFCAESDTRRRVHRGIRVT